MFDMTWQDLLLSAGNFIFFLALLPSIFSEHKPSFWTSVMTATLLTSFIFAFFTIDLMFSAIGVSFGAIGWWILTYQSFISEGNEHAPHSRED